MSEKYPEEQYPQRGPIVRSPCYRDGARKVVALAPKVTAAYIVLYSIRFEFQASETTDNLIKLLRVVC